ncbi:hypothetical protein CCACVL1_09418 [Corchorus capsularis]|uniref:Uncharacterized protein n=1 Tax=Corchorus capsularis TaxID=210143 RepID=A0A1R3IWC0_COCAP|nr:hypothetical protein CCACVL1_09418 [Corchorus capsularis]
MASLESSLAVKVFKNAGLIIKGIAKTCFVFISAHGLNRDGYFISWAPSTLSNAMTFHHGN